MEAVAALKRFVLALALVLSFGLHGAMQCQGSSTVSAASDGCSHHHNGCPHRSMPASPVKSCCANSACLTYDQCSDIEDATIVQAETAQFQPVSARVSISPLPSP